MCIPVAARRARRRRRHGSLDAAAVRTGARTLGELCVRERTAPALTVAQLACGVSVTLATAPARVRSTCSAPPSPTWVSAVGEVAHATQHSARGWSRRAAPGRRGIDHAFLPRLRQRSERSSRPAPARAGRGATGPAARSDRSAASAHFFRRHHDGARRHGGRGSERSRGRVAPCGTRAQESFADACAGASRRGSTRGHASRAAGSTKMRSLARSAVQ